MKILRIVVGICLILAVAWAVLLRARRGTESMAALRKFRYAHRGLYDKEAGIPENSLPAFSRAIARGFGAELDVHLLRDGTLAVFHDSDVKRMTGCEGYLEDLSADELKDYALDGTKEAIPQFKDVLALFAGTGLPLIVEVKSFRDNFAELTERTMAELDKFDVKYCVESFDPRCVAWLKKHRPAVIRGQLSCDFLKDRGNLSLPMAFATTNLLGNIMAQPDFVAYKFEDKKNWAPRLCRKLYGAQGVYWTIRSKEDLETAEREGAIAIFERFIPYRGVPLVEGWGKRSKTERKGRRFYGRTEKTLGRPARRNTAAGCGFAALYHGHHLSQPRGQRGVYRRAREFRAHQGVHCDEKL